MTVEAFTRRRALGLAAGAGVAAWADAGQAADVIRPIKAVCFDAFALFDPGAVFAAAKAVSPALGPAWFQKVFADTWLRTSAGRYVDFAAVAAETLNYVAASLGLTLTPGERDHLLAAFWTLDAWPDVPEGLARLKADGLRLAVLSNLTEPMMRANLRRNGIEALFEATFSADEAQAFKPSPRAYALGMSGLKLRKSEILFAPFAAWDAAGAAWFGYRTAWVNRMHQPAEPGARPVPTGMDLQVVHAGLGAPSR